MSPPVAGSPSATKGLLTGFQIIEFLCLGSRRADVTESTDIKLIRELDFEGFSSFLKNAQEIMRTVTPKPRTFVFVVSSDTLNEARKYQGNGDFISGLGLDLRAPQLQSYHSGFCGRESKRTLDIRFSAGTANQPIPESCGPGVINEVRLSAFDRRPNLVYYHYELGDKRSICLFSERRPTSSFLPTRERATIESIKALEHLSTAQRLSLHPFWVHVVLLYHVIETRSRPLEGAFDKLLAVESQLLDGSLVRTRPTDGFGQHIQDLHEILRKLITLEHSNEHDLSLIDNILADMCLLSKEASSLGSEYTLDPDSEARLKNAFLCLRHICEERSRKFKNRKQRAQNIVELLYNLTTNRDSLTSLEIAQKNADIARDTKRDSESMNTIAVLTLLYLPATLVCSFFGTNFFTLEVKDDGRQVFLVSERCWIYFLSTLLLTALTVFIWLKWLRRSAHDQAQQSLP